MARNKAKGKKQESLTDLRRRVRRLRAIIDAAALVNSTLDLQVIADHIVSIATRLLSAERGSLFLLDRETSALAPLVAHGVQDGQLMVSVGEGIVGTVARTGRPIILSDPYSDPRFNPRFDRETGFTTRSLLTVPVRDRGGELVAVLQLLNHKGHPFNDDDASFLGELGVPFAIALCTAQMHQQVVERERLREELRLAAEIQRTMQPLDLAHVPGLEIQALSNPCLEVGGDYFDLIPTDRGTWWLVVGDVSGKGVSAALVASNLQAFLWSRRSDPSPLKTIMAEANDLLRTLARGKKYATLVLAEWSPESQTLTWVNAGHPPMLLKRRAALEVHEATGVPLGLLRDRSYTQESAVLEGGDLLLLVTDGVTEAEGGAGEGEFGLGRVKACFDGAEGSAGLAERVSGALAEHLGGSNARDDVTLLCACCKLPT
jgi:sigma-B regulation protein RsbU (phosphoserine phosphatase)